MTSLPARIRRLSETYSPPPSPTMQALRIGSLHRSPGSNDPYMRPVHPAYVSRKSAATVDHADVFGSEDELEDDYEPEPALTSDEATAPSSSRAPSPSLSPVHENAYVDVVTSSPQRESFLHSYARPATPSMKPDPRDEDVAAVLLSLSFPRVGPSPLVSAVPPPPPCRPESPSPQIRLHSRAASAISEIKVDKEASRQSSPHRTSAVEEQLDEPALIDVPTEFPQLTEQSRSTSPVSKVAGSRSASVLAEIISPVASPLNQLSPLPPSSPLPEEDDDEDVTADIEEAHENSASRMSSPLSRLSSIPPSPTMDPEPLPADFELPQLELPARDWSLSPSPIAMSPLSSPPTSRPSSPIQTENSRAPSPVQLVRREAEIARPVHTKRKLSAPSAESPPRRKRARRIVPESSPEPESDVESIPMQIENEVESELDEPEPTPAPARRRARGKTSGGTRSAARVSKPAKGSKTKAAAPVHVDDRSDKHCPHPALPSLIVEAFALSRATSLPATALYDAIRASYPAMAGSAASATRSAAVAEEQGPSTLTQGTVEEVLLWGAARGIFELVPSSGDALPPTFFYIPDADWNKERSGLHSALGGRVARAGKRAYKQYYWKPVVLPRGGGGRSSRKRDQEEEVRKGWEVDWEE